MAVQRSLLQRRFVGWGIACVAAGAACPAAPPPPAPPIPGGDRAAGRPPDRGAPRLPAGARSLDGVRGRPGARHRRLGYGRPLLGDARPRGEAAPGPPLLGEYRRAAAIHLLVALGA